MRRNDFGLQIVRHAGAGALRLASFIAMVFMSTPVHAQEYSSWDRGIEVPNVSANVAPLDATSFGDKIGLYSGSVEFSNVDVAIPGNNTLAVEFRRSFRIEDRRESASGNAPLGVGYLGGAGEWDVDMPYLKGTFLDGDRWISDTSDQRCSLTFAPRDYPSFSADEYWHGNVMHIPGVTDETMLQAVDNAIPKPTDGLSYPWITKSLWRFRCKSTTANGYPGEAFIAVSPNGVKYHFDWVVTRGAPAIRLGNMRRERNNIYFLATLVEDRFGNWVRYGYTADKLTSITSSDGRSISIAYSNFNVSTVTSSLGTWTYTYAPNNRLEHVTQPDGSTWKYSATGRLFIEPPPPDDYEPTPNCSHNAHSLRGYGSFRYYVTSPSGANAEYAFTVNRIGRNNVPKRCNDVPGTQDPQLDTYLEIPTHLQNFTLRSKKVSGPGLNLAEWSYTYGIRTGFFKSECDASPCPATADVKVVGPEGKVETYTFGILFRVNDGQLLGTQVGTESSPSMSSTTHTYVQPEEIPTLPFPDRVGANLLLNSDSVSLAGLRPLKRSVVDQQGATFTWQANSFDAYANPLSVTRSSTLGYSRTDYTAYHHNTAKWVIGQAASSTCTAPTDCWGMVESQTDYDANALPWKTYAFGKLQQTFAYNADGTLFTVKDGKNNTTTFASWKRGLPQKITFADAKYKSAQVNDLGQIDWVEDENRYRTCYGYDTMGRLSAITYPSETATSVCDTSKWAQGTRSFAKSATAAYGLPAGHWRQTVKTGSGYNISYFDGLWRPMVVETYDSTAKASTLSQRVFRYDAAGRTTLTSYPTRIANAATMASWGNPAVSPIVWGTWTTYDALGRPVMAKENSELGWLTTTTEYLPGFQTRFTDPRGYQTATSYWAYDQPTYDLPRIIAHPAGAYTTYHRDVYGKPLSINRRNADFTEWATRYIAYYPSQEICKTSEVETGTTAYGYDAAGNLEWSATALPWSPTSPPCGYGKENGLVVPRRVDRAYDSRNRLKTLSFPDGRGNQSWTYTADGLPDTATAYNGPGQTQPAVTAYTYNHRRLLTGEALSVAYPSLHTQSLGYSYDANGFLFQHLYPSGLPLNYVPNALGQPDRASLHAYSTYYHPNGGMSQFLYGNGLKHTLTQNPRGLPDVSCDFVDSAGCTAAAVLYDGYDYDGNANVMAISDGRTVPRRNRKMGYDGLNRLTATGSCMLGTQTCWYYFDYDTLDNLTRVRTAVGGDRYYCYDAHFHLTNLKTGSCNGPSVVGLGYDERGNLANRNGQTFDFDYGNRLREATGKETYQYDALGRRVTATSATGTIYSFYSRAGQLMAQRNERLNPAKDTEYVYLNGSLVAERDQPDGGPITVAYVHTDALSTPVAMTDSTGAILQTSEYTPFGKLYNRPLTDGPDYTGHVADSLTGLIQMQQRYYDPDLQIFLSVDPIDAYQGGAFHRYWYANNNPYRFTDPDGRQSVGEMIDDKAMAAAARGDGLTTFGWAYAATAWNYLGFEGISQVADKGTNAGFGNGGIAILEVATLGKAKLVTTPIRSLIKADSFLVKAAQNAGKSVQKSLDALTSQLAKGNLNPGIGTKHLFSGVFEARARDGARVYFRNSEQGVEVLAKSSKANQDTVIERLREKYGK